MAVKAKLCLLPASALQPLGGFRCCILLRNSCPKGRVSDKRSEAVGVLPGPASTHTAPPLSCGELFPSPYATDQGLSAGDALDSGAVCKLSAWQRPRWPVDVAEKALFPAFGLRTELLIQVT